MLSFIYGEYLTSKREVLWSELQQIHQVIYNKAWALLGGFNSARYTDEKLGASSSHLPSYLLSTTLLPLPSYLLSTTLLPTALYLILDVQIINGLGITIQCTKRIFGRLDRVLCNHNWIHLLPESFYKYKSLASSDHAPITLHLLPDQDARPKPFRFFNY